MVQQMTCRLTHSCLQFHNLSPLIKCCCTLTVWLGVLDHSKSHFWDRVLCQLPRTYHGSGFQGMWFLFQSDTETNSSSRYVFGTIWGQNDHYCFSEMHICPVLFIDKMLLTVMCRGQIWWKKYHLVPKNTVINYSLVCCVLIQLAAV